ncbi:MAG: nickel pincer cofactor biosynthesis protein LarB [Planctomycetaceae bacterium]|jgi:NCAIR mutase (PurE)-related protein|nr:nickel pincer cofactor biosynthesis protein LarB [Planctomycetaceae bacterium]
MDHFLRQISEQFLNGKTDSETFLRQMSSLIQQQKTADVGEAQLDLDRRRRCGFPEVIFSEGKSITALKKILMTLQERNVDVLATRMTQDQADVICSEFPRGQYNSIGRTFRLPPVSGEETARHHGKVVILSAGTSDLPVAEEARETAVWTGAEVTLIQDVGVAGPHRLQANLHLLEDADAIVVIAGMEGALPSVVGGYVSCPIIAVPTSVGYGASFGGIAALLGMLNSCASNVTVVNIDAGFKGGYVAGLISRNNSLSRH